MSKLLLRLALSLLIGGGMLYLAVRKINFGSTWSALEEARYWLLVPFFATMALQHFFRAWRWGYLLAPVQPVPFARILPIATVGFAAIIALPLRMGELVRPYLIAAPPGLRISHGFGTLAVERVIDGLILALASFSAVAVARGSGAAVPSWLMGAGLLALGLFCAALIVLVLVFWQRQRAVELCRRLFGRISRRLGDRLAEVASGVVEGFQALPSWRRLLPYLGATAAYWLLNGASFWIMGLAFDLELSLLQGMAIMAIVGIGIMIPAGPGFIGNWELFAEAALALYAAPAVIARRGAAFILGVHAMNALWYLLTGALSLFSRQVSFFRVLEATVASGEAKALEASASAGTAAAGASGQLSQSPTTAAGAPAGKKMDKPLHLADAGEQGRGNSSEELPARADSCKS